MNKDILVINMSEHSTQDEAERMTNKMEEQFPDMKIVILPFGYSIQVIEIQDTDIKGLH